MMSASECFQKARELTKKAEQAPNDAHRAMLRGTALQWLTLGISHQRLRWKVAPRLPPKDAGQV
jgi:hypothetical protein